MTYTLMSRTYRPRVSESSHNKLRDRRYPIGDDQTAVLSATVKIHDAEPRILKDGSGLFVERKALGRGECV